MSEKQSRLLLISCLIVGTALLHHSVSHRLLYVHVLLQSLFFIPVSLAGVWFGKRGELIAALSVTAVYIHHAIMVMMPTSEMAVANAIQILLLFVVGFLTGTYSDVKRSYDQTIYGLKQYPVARFPVEQSLLVYIDDSGVAMNAVRYVATLFGRFPGVKVTLLGVLSKTNPDFFKTAEERETAQARSFESSKGATEKARRVLLENGFADANVNVRFAHSQGARVSDMILREQRSGDYSAIIVGRHQLSRTEEFLFGSVAIRLARRATCPVWIVGESPTGKPVNMPAALATESHAH